MNYILIGITFMFCVEYLLNLESIKKQFISTPHIGWTERFIGIILWPICLGIFSYNFFKTLFK